MDQVLKADVALVFLPQQQTKNQQPSGFTYFTAMNPFARLMLIPSILLTILALTAQAQPTPTAWRTIHQLYRDGNYSAIHETIKTWPKNPIVTSAQQIIGYQLQPSGYTHPSDTFRAIIQTLTKLPTDSLRNTWLIRAYSLLYHAAAESAGFEAAVRVAEPALHIADLEKAWPGDYTDLIYDLGYLFGKVGRHSESAANYRKAAARYEADPTTPPSDLALCYNNLAFSYGELGLTTLVIDHYRKAHELWWSKQPDNLSYNATALQNLVREVTEYGDYVEADSLLEKFTQYFQFWTTQNKWTTDSFRVDGAARSFALSFYYAQMRVYGSKRQEFLLVKTLQDVKQLYPQPKRNDSEYIYAMLEEIAFACKSQEQYDKAEQILQESVRYSPDAPFYQMKIAANRGILRYDQKRYDESLVDISYAIQQLPANSSSISLDMLWILQAELFARKGDSTQALRNTRRVLARLTAQDSASLSIQQLTLASFRGKTSDRHIDILLKAALIQELIAAQYQQPLYQSSARSLYQLAAQHFQYFYRKGRYNRYLDRLHKAITEGLLKTTTPASNQNEQDINQLEANASQHLWRKFLGRYEKNFQQQAPLLQEKQLLLYEMDYWSQQTDSTKLQVELIRKKLNGVNDKLAQLQSGRKQFTDTSFNVQSVQDALSDQQLALRFYVTDSSVFRADITNKQVSIHRLGQASSIRALTQAYYQQLIQIQPGYQETAEKLSMLLLDKLPSHHIQQLIILPESFLYYLPFETLIGPTKKPLVSQYAISYSYSLPLWMAQHQINRPTLGNQVLAVAPTYPSGPSNLLAKRGNFYALPFANQEATQIVSRYGGKLLQGSEATRQQFLALIQQYPILHLAMHAQMDTLDFEQSALVFDGANKLRFHELYTLDIKPQLVVLSACNTGMGQLESGEGFMSLSRALTYAGAPSLVYSLWEVPDEETAFIMEQFYLHLEQGLSKDVALQRAKQTFLAKYPLKQHPYFWAGFVLNGSTHPLQKSWYQNKWVWIGSGVGLLALAGFLFYRKRQRGRASNNLAA
jgi:CHAT domain-containing protein/tetratricopeptide (TPR) repeat protein